MKEIEIKKMYLVSLSDDHYPILEVEDADGNRYTAANACDHVYEGDRCDLVFVAKTIQETP